MRRYAGVGFALFLMLQSSFIAVGAEVSEPQGPLGTSFTENLRVLAGIPVQQFGRSTAAMTAKLGPPLSMRSKDVSNKHEPSQIDRIKTFNYKGLVVSIYDVVIYKKEILLSVRMTKNRPGVLPVLIGKDEKSIKTKYGNPDRVERHIHEYVLADYEDTGIDRICIEFRNSSVVAVEWNYYVD